MRSGTDGKDYKVAYIDGIAHQIKSNHTSILKFVKEHVSEKKNSKFM